MPEKEKTDQKLADESPEQRPDSSVQHPHATAASSGLEPAAGTAEDELDDRECREDDDYLLIDVDAEAADETGGYPHDGGPLSFGAGDPETEELWRQIGEMAGAGREKEAVARALAEELDDENRLTNEIMFARHPELGRRKLRRDERALVGEWLRIRDDVVRPGMRGGSTAKQASHDGEPVRLRKVRRGFSAYTGERVEVVLRGLREGGKLAIEDGDIEMLQRMANVETKGLVNAVNSWDSVFMSAGFMQWPILYKDPVGKLQRWIQRAPEAFARYGIELDGKRIWNIPMGKYTYKSIALVGAGNWRELRERTWAERFYRAGLDPDAVAAEAVLALEVTDHAKKRIVKRCGEHFLPFYEASVPLRALIQETFNHRPAWLYRSLSLAIDEARQNEIAADDSEGFLGCLHRGITSVYEARNKARSAKNLIAKTARLVL